MTKRLYYDDAYIRSFTAAVTSCTLSGGNYELILDSTAFYPLGGGQPADTGKIGGARVLDVRSRGGDVVHIVDAPLEPGVSVECSIDWARRFSLMQHHTGEHIISGIAHKLHGLENVGFHMGHDAVTIDFDGELSWEQLMEIEKKANDAVYENIPVEITHPDSGTLAAMPYRSKKELSGDVRIVTIPGCDMCACCGTHVRSSGEIGAIKLLDSQRYKGGVRVSLLCAARAMADYEQKNSALRTIAASFSTKLPQAVQAVENQHRELAALRLERSRLLDELFTLRSAALEGGELAVVFESGLGPDELRRFALALCARFPVAAVFSGDGAGYKYALAGAQRDVRPLCKSLNEAFSGRGGGKPQLAQGSITVGGETEIRELLEREL